MFLLLYLFSIVVFYISLFVVAVLLKHQLKKDEMYEKFKESRKEYDRHKNLLNRIKEKSQTVIISVIPIVNIIFAVTFFVTIDLIYEHIEFSGIVKE